MMIQKVILTTEKEARTANKGFAIVGRNCKIQRYFFGSTFVQN